MRFGMIGLIEITIVALILMAVALLIKSKSPASIKKTLAIVSGFLLVVLAVGFFMTLQLRHTRNVSMIGTPPDQRQTLYDPLSPQEFDHLYDTINQSYQSTQRTAEVSVSVSRESPPLWETDDKTFFPADVYPSFPAAARALAQSILQNLPADHLPAVLQIGLKEGESNIAPEILHQIAAVLQPKIPTVQVLTTTPTPADLLQKTADPAALLTLSLPQCQFHTNPTDHTPSPPSPGALIAGTLQAAWQSPTLSFTTSAPFVDKPWVENFAQYASQRPESSWLLAQSTQPAVTPDEAQQLALQNALDQLRARLTLIAQSAHRSGPLPALTEAHLARHHLITDRFLQSFPRPYGTLWQQWLLLDASSPKLRALAEDLQLVQTTAARSARRSWLFHLASLAGMITLICALYAFLNAATRGYYTAMLRLAAAVLIALGVFLVWTIF